MQSLLSFVPDFLKQELFWVMALLVFAIWQFIQNKLRMDVVALIVMLFFSLTNILSVKEVLAGLSDPNVVLIALLFIVGEGLVRTGVANQVSDWLMRVSGASETKVLVLLMLCIAGLGSFMSSTGIVAIFIPVVLAICSGMGISPRRLMMPLSVAGLISGMMTLIATPPNLVAHSELVKSGFEGFNFFSFTPIGLIILVMGIGYMLIARRWLDNGEQSNTHSQAQKFSMSQLIEEYQLKERAKMVLVEADSDCVGKSIGQLNLRIEQGLNIIAIQRTKRFRKITVSASVNEIFQPKDILLLDTALDDETYQQRCEQLKLRPIELKGEYFSSQYRSVGMAEISVMPEAECIGKTIRELKFRSRYHLSIVGLKRGDEIIQEELLDTPLKFGDILLVMGVWQQIHRMDDDHRDFFLLRDPAESKKRPSGVKPSPSRSVLSADYGVADDYRHCAKRDGSVDCLLNVRQVPLCGYEKCL
ncbi:Na(+)/dicarboxylate symporter [Mannheimia haemolytica]|uniref:Na(+)/dicarboxylate symporter n=1 Tax=Mannheimia haemolytica TaxID=75985 RepID=A0A378MUN8_MANHA|nr:Na(+)/dicarboxylate symporter [Mannheimia haemolytica]